MGNNLTASLTSDHAPPRAVKSAPRNAFCKSTIAICLGRLAAKLVYPIFERMGKLACIRVLHRIRLGVVLQGR